jgi:hypothetical protein
MLSQHQQETLNSYLSKAQQANVKADVKAWLATQPRPADYSAISTYGALLGKTGDTRHRISKALIFILWEMEKEGTIICQNGRRTIAA